MVLFALNILNVFTILTSLINKQYHGTPASPQNGAEEAVAQTVFDIIISGCSDPAYNTEQTSTLGFDSQSDFPGPQLVDIEEDDRVNYNIEEEMSSDEIVQEPADIDLQYKQNAIEYWKSGRKGRKAIKGVIVHKRKNRDAAALFGIKKSTLHFHVQRETSKFGSDSGNDSNHGEHIVKNISISKYASQQVLSAEEEAKLENYMLKASSMNFGLTYQHSRSLAFQYAKKLNKKYPALWDENMAARIESMRSATKCYPQLSYRKPENISIARASGFKAVYPRFYRHQKLSPKESHVKYRDDPLRSLTLKELEAIVEDLDLNEEIDICYIPPDVDDITDEEDIDDNVIGGVENLHIDIAGDSGSE
ncbi:dehydrogenase/reductase sdr family member 11 [Holotrichia oblita]|uniref:Dehydrogenase/reductase sdr family member 11 n=1 Tax=Holotrichia oblita TaxID=644536 RepID=A0ACB9SYR6_HOLOL|nr:dehydrogenase/reductase sdr family member 11 [Holotrichia oblita]